jgi:hypothetical protein
MMIKDPTLALELVDVFLPHESYCRSLRRSLRAAVKNVRLGEADGLKNFHPQKWVPNAMK